MNTENKTIGFAVCGSFCTFKRMLSAMDSLKETGVNIIPIMSEMSYSTDTRFGECEFFRNEIIKRTGNEIIHTIKDAEPIGPKAILDALVILPCTGNTLAKLANGITDSCVTLAAKAHLRNNRPVIIGVSTNDGLATAAQNIGKLLTRKNIYFIPFSQDDYINKPNSLVADFSMLTPTLDAAFKGKQFQPILAV